LKKIKNTNIKACKTQGKIKMADKKIAEESAEKAKKAAKLAADKLDEYYSKLPINQETKDKAKIIAGEAREKAKNIFKIIIDKLDKYYNKLPLDKINEKLGGKVDVKSKKIKIGGLLILIFCIIFFFCSTTESLPDYPTDPYPVFKEIDRSKIKDNNDYDTVPKTLTKDSMKNALLCLHTNPKLVMEYAAATSVDAYEKGRIDKNGKTIKEYVEACKKHWNESAQRRFKDELATLKEESVIEQYKTQYENGKNDKKNAVISAAVSENMNRYQRAIARIRKKGGIALKARLDKYRKEIIKKGPGILNEEDLSDTYLTCQSVSLSKKPYNWDYEPAPSTATASVRWHGTAILKNSQTRKTIKRKIDITYSYDVKSQKAKIFIDLEGK
jgi:hypothetical protein